MRTRANAGLRAPQLRTSTAVTHAKFGTTQASEAGLALWLGDDTRDVPQVGCTAWYCRLEL